MGNSHGDIPWGYNRIVFGLRCETSRRGVIGMMVRTKGIIWRMSQLVEFFKANDQSLSESSFFCLTFGFGTTRI